MTPDAKHRAGTAVPAQTPTTRRVRLIKTHIHAGLPHKVGDEINLLHDLADWLIAEGAAEEIAPAAATTAATPAPAATSTPSIPTTPNKKDKSV